MTERSDKARLTARALSGSLLAGGSAHSFGFAIYSAAHDRHQHAVPRIGLPTGTSQEALDTACTIHLAGLDHQPDA